MKRRTRKYCVKNADINTNKEELRSTRQTVIRWVARRKTTMGAGNSQVYNQTDDLGQEGNILKSVKELSPPSQTLMDNQSVNTSASQKDGKNPDPTNTKPACIKGCTTSELLHCTQCLTTQLLCSSCLYPCTSAACPNKLCPIVSTLLTCEVVSDPKSKVHGCPMFRACPKCHNLIMHEQGCKFVRCSSCNYRFCFICLQDDCSKDAANYWLLTCTKQRAERQRFFSPQS
ncbi:hypothetical protein PO909_025815 [Leuciscus waleckii]